MVGCNVAVDVGVTVGALAVGPVEATLEVVVSSAGLVVESTEDVVASDDENSPIPVP